MAARKLKITYQDGSPEDIVKVLPRAYAMTEAYLKGFSAENLYAATYYLGWSALQSLGRVTVDYETWLNRIEEVEDYEDPETPDVPIEEVPPTQPATSVDDSSV